MNIDGTRDAAAEGSGATLPELDDRRIDEIESALFAEIARDRRAQRARRGRIWLGGTAAAAIVVIAAIAVPAIIRGVGASSSGSSGDYAVSPQYDSNGSPDKGLGGGALPSTGEGIATDGDGSSTAGDGSSDVPREVVTTATATVEAADVSAAISRISAAAADRKGYVEAMSIGATGVTADGLATTAPDDAIAQKGIDVAPRDGGWVTVRVPADQLSALVADLSSIGKVQASAIDRSDVTAQAIDLRARIDALEASVHRLTALMAKAGSVADLLTAESALSERQATLESYQQQLKALEDQVAMSSLTVTVTPHPTVVEANPAGFGDGLAAGWSGFVATLNGIVVGVGFLLPWIAVIAIVALVVWGVVRLVRALRSRRERPVE